MEPGARRNWNTGNQPWMRICRENPCSNDEACLGMLVGMPKYLSTANTRPKPKQAGH